MNIKTILPSIFEKVGYFPLKALLPNELLNLVTERIRYDYLEFSSNLSFAKFY
jgi:hypothetical protein